MELGDGRLLPEFEEGLLGAEPEGEAELRRHLPRGREQRGAPGQEPRSSPSRCSTSRRRSCRSSTTTSRRMSSASTRRSRPLLEETRGPRPAREAGPAQRADRCAPRGTHRRARREEPDPCCRRALVAAAARGDGARVQDVHAGHRAVRRPSTTSSARTSSVARRTEGAGRHPAWPPWRDREGDRGLERRGRSEASVPSRRRRASTSPRSAWSTAARSARASRTSSSRTSSLSTSSGQATDRR